MKKRLLHFICCPVCQEDFTLHITRKSAEIEEGVLRCKGCGRTYPIVKGVPIFLNSGLKNFKKTKKHWEDWWAKVRKKSDVELFDRLWVRAEKNLGGEPLFKKTLFKNKVLFDAGCGTGRYIHSDFSKYGCKEIIALDLGEQIFEAKRVNNASNTHFVQGDLTMLPFKNEVFDVVVSHGVLHHTPHPQKTFSHLAQKLKKGGLMAIYVYHKEWAYFKTHKKSLFLDLLYGGGASVWLSIRWLVSRLPHVLILLFVYLMAIKSTLASFLTSKKGTRRLGKLLTLSPPFAYIGVNFHERLVRNYDHYSATFNSFQSIEEVVDWFSQNGFNHLEITSVPVSIRGVKEGHSSPLFIKQYPILDHFRFRKEWERLYELECSKKRKCR